ncbi:hypothetical protein HWV62_37269 [Athelia sp. TMB]|nr:hypothetical protein HWV62_37269 [Athelia sp. TMB]
MAAKGAAQPSSRKNPPRAPKKAATPAQGSSTSTRKKPAARKAPTAGPSGKPHNQKRGQIKSAEFVEDTDDDSEKLPAESEERDEQPEDQLPSDAHIPTTAPESSPLPIMTPSPAKETTALPSPTMADARTAPTPPAIAVLPTPHSAQRSPSQSPSTFSQRLSPLSLPADIRPVGPSASSAERAAHSSLSPAHGDDEVDPLLGPEALSSPSSSERRGTSRGVRPPGTPMPDRRSLSPLGFEDDTGLSPHGSPDSNASMTNIPGPMELEFEYEDLQPESDDITLKRSLLGRGGNTAEIRSAVEQSMVGTVDVKSRPHADADAVSPSSSRLVRPREQLAHTNPRAQPTSGDALPPLPVSQIPRVEGAPNSPHTPQHSPPAIRTFVLGNQDNNFVVSPNTGRIAHHFIRNNSELVAREKWQTPPQKVVERGHRFLDFDESPANHRRNLPHMYDADGNPLDPELPSREDGYDVGFVPRQPLSSPPSLKESVTAEQWNWLKKVTAQGKAGLASRYAYNKRKSDPQPPPPSGALASPARHSPHDDSPEPAFTTTPTSSPAPQPSRSPSPAPQAPPSPPPAPRASRSPSPVQARPRRAAAERAASEMKVTFPPGEDIFEDSVEPFMVAGDVSSGSEDDFEDGPAGAQNDEDESDDEPMDDTLDDERPPRLPKGRKSRKGKEKAVNAEAGPSDLNRGRPTVADNVRVQELAKNIKNLITDLATDMGVNYPTMVRKLGFSNQEVRSGDHLANVYKMVEKHNRDSRGESRWSAQQYSAAYRSWKADNVDNPDAAHELLQKHQDILAQKIKPLKSKDIEKRVTDVGAQMATLAKNYMMGYNIAVIGAVIHLGAENASLTFASDVEQNLAVVKGFEVDQQEWLLKAKSILMLQADKAKRDSQAPEAEVKPNVSKGFWTIGQYPRDDYKRFVKLYLTDRIRALINPPPTRWEGKRWPRQALANNLVLVGWGPDISDIPNESFRDKTAGQLRKEEWEALTTRIPKSWKDNELRLDVPAGEYDLNIIPLDDFLKKSPQHLGRHPCIADHKGHVLWFADDGKSALKARAPAKGRRAPRATSKGKKAARSPSPASADDKSGSDSSNVEPPPVHYRVTGPSTPSGHPRKRVRVEGSDSDDSPPRPSKPLPVGTRQLIAHGKRKRDEAVSPEPPAPMPPPVPPGRVMQGLAMRADAVIGGPDMDPRSTRPSPFPKMNMPVGSPMQQRYPSPYLPPGYPPLPSYGPPSMYPQQQYGGSYFPPHFTGHQQWPPSGPQHLPQWGNAPAEFARDDYQRSVQRRMMQDRQPQ